MDRNGVVAIAQPSALRTVAILTLAAVALVLTLPSLARLIPGTFRTTGLLIDEDGVVTRVIGGSPAALAGLRPGDRIALRSMSYADRTAALDGLTAIKTPITLAVQNHGSLHTVRVTPVAENVSSSLKTTILVRQLQGVLFITLGTLVALRRPSILSLSFFLYCLRNNGSSALGTLVLAPTWLMLPLAVVHVALLAIGLVGFVVFALHFPTRDAGGWRDICERSVPYLFASLFIVWILPSVLPYAFGIGSQFTETVLFFYGTAIELLGFAVIADTYIRSRGLRRRQVEWVFIGFGITICFETLGFALAFHSSWFPFTVPPHVLQGLFIGMGLGPFAVAYAIFRHHILDINFVINRTLVYAVVTSVLVAGFALIDFVLHEVLASTRLTLVAEIGAALLAGFWINGLHRGADRLVDRVLYRRRYEADRRLERASAGILHAHSKDAVDRMLVHEPVEALTLASAAIFRTTDDGVFRRSFSKGWPTDCSALLDRDDPLALHLSAHHEALDPSEIRGTTLLAPSGAGRPTLAIPLVLRHQLLGIALYSAHTAGDRLDPLEAKMLENLVTAATAAYDHLEAVILQQRCETLEKEVAELRERWQSAPK